MRPVISLRKTFSYLLLIASLAPLLFISQNFIQQVSKDLLNKKEQQVNTTITAISQEIHAEFIQIEQSLDWFSHDRFNVQVLDNILYSSVINQNILRFSEFSELIDGVYLLNDEWEALYDYNGRAYPFEQSTLLNEIKQVEGIYQQGKIYSSFYYETELIKGGESQGGVVLVAPMLTYQLQNTASYKPSGYIVVLIEFSSISAGFKHFLLNDEDLKVNEINRFGIIPSDTKKEGIEEINRLFSFESPVFEKPLTLNLTYRFSDTTRLEEMKSSRRTLFGVLSWTFITVLIIAMVISRWVSRQFFEMEKNIVSYTKNQKHKESRFQFLEFKRMSLILKDMSSTISKQLYELKKKNVQLEDSKKLIETANLKLESFNQELEIQVKEQTAQLSESLSREALHKNNLAAVIEFGSDYKSVDFHNIPSIIEQQLHQLIPSVSWQFSFDPLAGREGMAIMSSQHTSLASVLFTRNAEVEHQNLVFELFIKQLSAWLELATMARCDGLLGCPNRKAFDEDFKQVSRLFKDNPSLSFGLFILDVNGLKKLNDQCGHHFGDDLIKTCCQHIMQTLPSNATLYRIGGDEFVILLLGSTAMECGDLMHQLESNQKDLYVLNDCGTQYKAHYSIGWANTDNHKTTDLFSVADKQMYQNKRAYYEALS